MPQRDDEGCFMSDDDRGDYRQGRNRYDSDDYNGGRSSRVSNDDDYDDNRSSRRSASGGSQRRCWFGDPEVTPAQAATAMILIVAVAAAVISL